LYSQLEKNLDARVYTASNLEELNNATNKPQEITLEYLSSPDYQKTPLFIKVKEKLGTISRYNRCFKVTADILASLGPWCSDHMWKIILTDLERKMSTATQDLDRDALIDEDLALKETHEFIDVVEFPRNPNYSDSKLFSPKVARLINVLKIFVDKLPDFCGIIFVEQRHTAVAMLTLIESLDILNKARCGVLIGHGSTDEGDIQMSFKDQNRVIEKFRTGELNLLIATNVAEEGLDIQPCNVVFRFDFFNTLIAYIQSRGRARRPDSKYILMVEKNNKSQLGMLEEFRALEKDLKSYIQALPEDRNVARKFAVRMDVDFDSDEDYDSDDEDYLENSVIVPETGATITKQNAVPLIHRYCSSLPSDSFCVLKPVFEIVATGDGYVCTLRLPSNAAFQVMESPVVRSKDHARALVALKACAQLLTMKALDKHLMPHNLRKEILGEMAPQYDENGFIIGSRRRHGLYEKRTPGFWDRKVEEEEEAVCVEDNPDLLRAQAPTTVTAVETLHINEKQESVGTEAGVEDTFELLGKIDNHGPIRAMDYLVDDDGKLLKTAQPIENGIAYKSSTVVNEPCSPVDGNLNSSSNGPPLPKLVDASEGTVSSSPSESTINQPEGTETKQTEEKITEELGDGPFSCWFTVLEVQLENNTFEGIPYRRLCLITKKPFPKLDDLKLFHKSVPFMVKIRNVETEIIFGREKILLLSAYMLKLMTALINKEFHCPVLDVPYYIVPLIKNSENTAFEDISAEEFQALIDWDEVNSITESKVEPFSLDGFKDPHDSIVIDSSDNMRRYFVTQVRYDMAPKSPVPDGLKIREAGYTTFEDYYREKLLREDIDTHQPLLQVQRLKKVMNLLYPGHIVPAQMKGPLSTWTLPSFCLRFFMSASVYQAMMMIPSIMTRIDSILLCRQAAKRYDLPITDQQMLEAYTTPSASMEMNYERLETLGGKL
jgi:hypothetical protein